MPSQKPRDLEGRHQLARRPLGPRCTPARFARLRSAGTQRSWSPPRPQGPLRRACQRIPSLFHSFLSCYLLSPPFYTNYRIAECPTHIGREGWTVLGREGIRRKTISSGDLSALAEAARAAEILDNLHSLLEECGHVEIGKDGTSRPSAVFRELRQWTSEYRSWLKVLGLTPSSRASVEPVREQKGETSLDCFRKREPLHEVKNESSRYPGDDILEEITATKSGGA
ncbi:MAG: hypothetical protein DRJ65_22360 [Acidobacteria bacterium]|nr:MAG: hypothetical protein DRJ65_22360 [Acidobacteriota bacterium]